MSNNSHPNLWIETDLEPDDVLALYLLPPAKFYVVSEGNAEIKERRIRQYLNLLNIKDPVVLRGFNSSEKFSEEGKEFDVLPEIVKNQTPTYLEALENFAQCPNPVFFSFKPMRELLSEYKKNPEKVRSLISQMNFFAYGGFNFRTLYGEGKENILSLLSGFRKVVIYESFSVSGENNSLTEHNAPECYRLMNSSSDPYLKVLLTFIKFWNQHMLDHAEKVLQRPNVSEVVRKRQEKIIRNVKESLTSQMLLADFGLVLLWLNNVQPVPIVNLKFNDYTSFDFDPENSTSKFFAYGKVSFDQLTQFLATELKNRSKNE